jgi:predicted membrane-bound dolichyl-phosphate-mannose-protein mannosyltransferase
MSVLDPPLTALLLLSAFLTYLFYRSDPPRRSLLFSLGITLGLATATKMLAIAFFPILGGMVLLKIYQEADHPVSEMGKAVFLVGGLSVLVFLGTYLILGYTLKETWELVVYMFAWHRTAGSMTSLTSRWYEWLYIGNPIFYFYKQLAPGQWQALIATGNLVLWVGAEFAALYALIRFWRRPEIWMLALLVILQFALYTQKRSTFIHYMTEILPFLYILLGVTVADLWDRYGNKYRRILQVDLGLFAVGALLIFLNYWPYIWGRPITAEQFQKASGFKVAPNATPASEYR